MFVLVKTTLSMECGTCDVSSEFVAKYEEKDVLNAIISTAFHNMYEDALAGEDSDLVTFNGYLVEDIQEEGIERVLSGDTLVIMRDVVPSHSEIITYTIIEDN